MKYKYILFDLDGTLTDPAEGITNSIMYALEKYGINVSDRKELYKFIGPPLLESFEKYYGFSKEEAKTAVEYYREYYRDKGIFENLVYHGFEDLLKTLKDNNRILIVATSKPEVFARQILEHFDIAKFFTYIAGSNLDGTRVKKCEVIKYAVESCNIIDLSKAIMIGDREYDIIGAKDVGITSIGVLFGYGSRNELEKAGADFIASSVEYIGKILLEQFI
ncbi:HAD family hydrolase [Herbivorax sp. ANBcel31]|uniref:HAD family hydrolase n=1 Tax=Herbivorax sp. ANBcel31 TaxID=3069754 RepID=UPI0027B0E8D4|nr:HAD family hydrolase [Herbivorax sp. ANBcel31]MDQ2085332.1 HAD family hydrolase [Herbivorax sp. ANBcel31]